MDPNKLTSYIEHFLRFANLQKEDASELKCELQLYFPQPRELHAAHMFVKHEVNAFHGDGKFDMLRAATNAREEWASMTDLQREIWVNRHTVLLSGDICMLQSFENDVDHWIKRSTYERHVESRMAEAASRPNEAGATSLSIRQSLHSTGENTSTAFGSHQPLPRTNEAGATTLGAHQSLHSTSENGSTVSGSQYPLHHLNNTGPTNFSTSGPLHKAGNTQATISAYNPQHRQTYNESTRFSSPFLPDRTRSTAPIIKVEAQEANASGGTFVAVPFASGTNAAMEPQLNKIPQPTKKAVPCPKLPNQPKAHFWQQPSTHVTERAYIDSSNVGFEAFRTACELKFKTAKTVLEVMNHRGQFSARLRLKGKIAAQRVIDITGQPLTVGNITYMLKSFEDTAPQTFFAKTEAVLPAFVISAIAAVVGEKFILEKSQDGTIFVVTFAKNITSTGFEINVHTTGIHKTRTVKFKPGATSVCRRCNLTHPQEIGCVPTQLVPAPAWPVEGYMTELSEIPRGTQR